MSFDGTPVQAGLAREAAGLTGHYPNFAIIGLREMVVIGVRYVDDPENRSRSSVEYVCRDLYTGEALHGVRRIVSVGGLDDGDDAPLRAQSKLQPGAKTLAFSDHTQASDTDGDRVVVGFIEGSRQRAVIIGVLTHRASKYGATIADGQRRLTLHKNTSLEIKADGSYNIKRTSAAGEVTSIVIQSSGDIVISGPGARLYQLKYTGADAVQLGEDPTDHAVKGETHMATFNDLVAKVNEIDAKLRAHVHSGGTINGSTGNPVGLPPTNASPMTSDDLSTVVKLR